MVDFSVMDENGTRGGGGVPVRLLVEMSKHRGARLVLLGRIKRDKYEKTGYFLDFRLVKQVRLYLVAMLLLRSGGGSHLFDATRVKGYARLFKQPHEHTRSGTGAGSGGGLARGTPRLYVS